MRTKRMLTTKRLLAKIKAHQSYFYVWIHLKFLQQTTVKVVTAVKLMPDNQDEEQQTQK